MTVDWLWELLSAFAQTVVTAAHEAFELAWRADLSVLFVVGIAIYFASHWIAPREQRYHTLALWTAGALFFAFIAGTLLVRPNGDGYLLEVAIRIGAAAAICLAVAYLVVPLAAGLAERITRAWRGGVRSIIASVRAWRQRRASRRQQRLWERQRPLREAQEIRRRSEEQARRQQEAHAARQREDVRIRCELYYDRYASELANRFSRSMFQDYLRRYLGDERSPEEVERRGWQLEELIRFHVAKIEPPKECQTIEDLSRWHREEKRRIDALDIDPFFKQEYVIRLNARYSDLVTQLLSEMKP